VSTDNFLMARHHIPLSVMKILQICYWHMCIGFFFTNSLLADCFAVNLTSVSVGWHRECEWVPSDYALWWWSGRLQVANDDTVNWSEWMAIKLLLQLQPFSGVRDNLGETVPEETFTHSHLSWSSIIAYLLPPSFTIHGTKALAKWKWSVIAEV